MVNNQDINKNYDELSNKNSIVSHISTIKEGSENSKITNKDKDEGNNKY